MVVKPITPIIETAVEVMNGFCRAALDKEGQGHPWKTPFNPQTERLAHPLDALREEIFNPGSTPPPNIVLSIPVKKTSEAKHKAIVRILNKSVEMQSSGVEEIYDSVITPYRFEQSDDKRTYDLIVSGNSKARLAELSKIIASDLRGILQDPSNWERVKVPNSPDNPKGIGFMIKTYAYSSPLSNIAYAVASSLKSGYSMQNARSSFTLRGIIVDRPSVDRAINEGRVKRGEVEQCLVLSGKAATDIIQGYMGVKSLESIPESPQNKSLN